MNRLRFWLLRRCYRRIVLLEDRLMGTPEGGEAAEMRVQFSRTTVRMVDRFFRAKGVTRQARRQFTRKLARGA